MAFFLRAVVSLLCAARREIDFRRHSAGSDASHHGNARCLLLMGDDLQRYDQLGADHQVVGIDGRVGVHDVVKLYAMLLCD